MYNKIIDVSSKDFFRKDGFCEKSYPDIIIVLKVRRILKNSWLFPFLSESLKNW